MLSGKQYLQRRKYRPRRVTIVQILRNISPTVSPSFESAGSGIPVAVFGSLLLEVVVAAPRRASAAEDLAQYAVASFSPSAGPVDSTVVISGCGLGRTISVTINGVPASFAVTAAYQITATVPAGAGTGPIVVHSSTAMAQSNVDFVVIPKGTTPPIA